MVKKEGVVRQAHFYGFENFSYLNTFCWLTYYIFGNFRCFCGQNLMLVVDHLNNCSFLSYSSVEYLFVLY